MCSMLCSIVQEGDRLIYCECILNAEYAAAAALEAVQMGSAFKGFAKVTGECTDICALAACHSEHGTGQAQCGVVRYVYPA